VHTGQIPLLFGANGCGKQTGIDSFAAFLGKFIFNAFPFPDLSQRLVTRLMIGTVESGSWLTFLNIHGLKSETISRIFDVARYLNAMQQTEQNSCQLGSRTISINRTACIFMTTSDSAMQHRDILPPLRGYARPLALFVPSAIKMTESYLAALGFKSAKHIASKLPHCVASVIQILHLSRVSVFYCFKIIEGGHPLLLQFIHGNNCSYLNYYDHTRSTEEFCVASSAFNIFKMTIGIHQQDVLIGLLFASFPLFESIDAYRKRIIHPDCFNIDRIEKFIVAYLT
jgi:hypothetical protein